MRTPRRARLIGLVIAIGVSGRWQGDISARPAPTARVAEHASAGQASQSPARGQSVTRLADGRYLLVGGEGTEAVAWLWNPQTGATTPTSGALQVPRAWHSATVLSDGTVLVIGGRNGGSPSVVPEVFDPVSGAFMPLGIEGSVSRAFHTATLLPDGRVLVAGGADPGGAAVQTEIWDPQAQSVTLVNGVVARVGHSAILTAGGRVLVTGGQDHNGAPAPAADIVDPQTRSVVHVTALTSPQAAPMIAQAMPSNGATDVPVDTRVALLFSDAMNLATLTAETLMVRGPEGAVAVTIVPAEDGRLVFLWPAAPLEPGTKYVVSASGVVDRWGLPLMATSIAFTTASRPANASEPEDAEAWLPDASRVRNGWRTQRPPSPWESLAPLVAPPGVTAISGRVLTLDGRPLPGVTLEMDGVGRTESDRTGRFLLRAPSASARRYVLEIEGETASRPGRHYGFFEYGMTVTPGQTNVLPFTIWMPKLDTRHEVTIPSPTTTEVVVTTPAIPGLELRLPLNTSIRDHHGDVVRAITITPVPLDRPPFPLPAGLDVPLYFTVQPGGAYVYVSGVSGRRGARLIYPNGLRLPPSTRMDFWRYEPEGPGWHVYGHGQVTASGQQVAPDPGVELYEFTGAMVAPPGLAPATGPTLDDPPAKDGDPVDLNSGLFISRKTDLALADVMPIAVTRTYRQDDTRSRAFGIGASHPYEMFLVGNTFPYTYTDLILEDGARVHYDRVSAGTGYLDAVYEHVTTPTRWYKSSIAWNGTGWTLTLKDGTVLTFRDGFQATRPMQAALTSIRDRYGNLVTLTRDANFNLTRITAPNGRWITLTYDASYRITQLADTIGRTVGYVYDASGRLWKVTDPAGGVSEYTYDASHRMLTLKDARGLVFLTNAYDTSNRVVRQTQVDGGTYQFAYTLDAQGRVTQTDVTNPRGSVRRVTFNTDRYSLTTVEAVGTAVARTTTMTRQTGTNFITSVTDGLNRRTDYTYDSTGHVLTTTRLAGTADAVTTTFTYEPTFFQVATVTDPLSHTWTVGYTSGKPTSVTDPLAHQTTMGLNAAGQLTSVTDALGHVWQWGYVDGDLTSMTDPLSAVRTQFVDAAGRVVSTTDPLGRVTRTVFDKLNRVTSVTDPLGAQTTFTYDANSNLLSLTDALTHATSYAYDNTDRVATRTDPLAHAASSAYDLNGNLTQTTDRKSQVTSWQYDPLDRMTQVTFADTSTVASTYDAGDRVTQIVDSANGTITRQYDGLDRLTQETTPQGTVSYTYDADGRRATMTVAGQTAVSYGYDSAHRLTSITQGSATVALTYDDANRRSTLTFPNGIVATSGYDAGNQLTSLTYTLGQTTLGTLTYTYDAADNRTSVGGTWARTGIPPALTSATYDAANRIATWGGTTFSYDPNGNLTSDGTTTYTWNARNHLTGLSGGVSASFAYDGGGRRRGKTVGSMTTNFLYDGPNLVQELTSGGTPTANLLTGLGIDETFTRTDSSGTRTLLVDALGSTLELADASGTLQTHYTYDPFGATTASGTSSTNGGQFTGRENDSTGLYNYRARYHNPIIGRFTSEDPIGFHGGVNLYTYVGNGPTNFVDPSGTQALPLPKPGPGPVVIGPVGPLIWFDAWILQHDWNEFQKLCLASGWAWCSPSQSSPSPVPSSQPSPDEKCEKQRCKQAKQYCIERCTETLPTRDHGKTFFKCLDRCLKEFNCAGLP